jgi:uncharacterized membrane protein required for colicin V production
MNWIDALILLVLVIPIFIGYRRGLLRTVMPLVAAICGVVVAGIFHESMADLLAPRIHSLALANVVAFVLVFGLFMTAGITLLSIGRRSIGKSVSLFNSAWGGLTGTLLPLSSIVLGVALAGIFYGAVADLLSTWIDSRGQATIVAFLIIFVLVMVASIELFLLVSTFAGNPPRVTLPGPLSTLGGAALGFAIGAILAGAMLSIITKDPSAGMQTTIGDSAMADFFLNQFPFVLHLLPDEFHTVRDVFG